MIFIRQDFISLFVYLYKSRAYKLHRLIPDILVGCGVDANIMEGKAYTVAGFV